MESYYLTIDPGSIRDMQHRLQSVRDDVPVTKPNSGPASKSEKQQKKYGVFSDFSTDTVPIFAMSKMSPRESQLLAVGVVRWAPNLHMFDSTHQDLSFHGEGRSIYYGITPYCVEN